MAPWFALILYLGTLWVLIRGGYALMGLWRAWRIARLTAHEERVRREHLKARMRAPYVPRPPNGNRANYRDGSWRG